MERSHIIRQSLVALAVGAWCFVMLALASFHPTDWPSHTVYPYPPIGNLCGAAGTDGPCFATGVAHGSGQMIKESQLRVQSVGFNRGAAEDLVALRR